MMVEGSETTGSLGSETETTNYLTSLTTENNSTPDTLMAIIISLYT